MEIKKLSLKSIYNDLKNGFTRWEKDNLGFGSIEKKYDLTFTEMKQVIEHPKLKGIKSKIPTLLLIDDFDEETNIEIGQAITKEIVKEEVKIEKKKAVPFLS